ncbi:MAG TPA: nitroreductase family deazaflavin-dependent oxidoreductase [Caldilineaceae bacterium]|nr:nitroreductase family deazaflavin-dependent oxidoreductase [Caldilineaceae bacterium]
MNALLQFFLKIHVFLYRYTKGKIGGKLGNNPILLLNTVGRKSGKAYTTPLVCVRDGATYVVIASNGGADRHPGWYYNLRAQEETVIEVMGKIITVTAEEMTGGERDRLWQQIVVDHPQFADYQKKTNRPIPLFRLTPA